VRPFDGGLGADRYEHERGNIAVLCVQNAGARMGLQAFREKFERDLTRQV
jgi:hypothetical protein